jgi:signal peptide peptidase SppA
MLFIEREVYRAWLEEARTHAGDSIMREKLRSPEAVAALSPGRKVSGDLAVINLSGFITQKPSIMSILFGGTSAEAFAQAVVGALGDDSIGAVVMNVDSPGGTVFGVPEAAAAIRAVRGSKPLLAVANPLMASAAYYLASQADEIVALPSALVGSIGVYVAHVDESKALEREGLNVTEITYGRRKAELSSAAPLTEEARTALQDRVDYYGKLFESDVAKGRGIQVSTVRANYGEGAIFTAKDAQAAGLIDRIGTLDQVIGELAAGRRPSPRMALEVDPIEISARAVLAGVSTGKGGNQC